MACLDRSAILGPQDLRGELVPIPEWGGDVWIGRLTGYELAQLDEARAKGGDTGDAVQVFMATVAAVAIRDEKGERVFADADIPALARRSFIALERVLQAANRINGMGAKAVEAAEKKS